MKVFDYSWHEKQCIKVLSSLSSCCFGIHSFTDSVTDTIKVRNIQESKRKNALNDMNNHKPNAFKLIKLLLRDSQFPGFRNGYYQSQENSRKQEGTYLWGLQGFVSSQTHIFYVTCKLLNFSSVGWCLPSSSWPGLGKQRQTWWRSCSQGTGRKPCHSSTSLQWSASLQGVEYSRE